MRQVTIVTFEIRANPFLRIAPGLGTKVMFDLKSDCTATYVPATQLFSVIAYFRFFVALFIVMTPGS